MIAVSVSDWQNLGHSGFIPCLSTYLDYGSRCSSSEWLSTDFPWCRGWSEARLSPPSPRSLGQLPRFWLRISVCCSGRLQLSFYTYVELWSVWDSAWESLIYFLMHQFWVSRSFFLQCFFFLFYTFLTVTPALRSRRELWSWTRCESWKRTKTLKQRHKYRLRDTASLFPC